MILVIVSSFATGDQRSAPPVTGDNPQLARQGCPGASAITSRPERNASGGQVIGSTATDRRYRCGGSESPVNTCHQPNDRSAQIRTPDPSGPVTDTEEPPSASGTSDPNAVSSTSSPIRRAVLKSHSVPSILAAPIGSSRPSVSSRDRAGTRNRSSATGTPGTWR